MKHDKPHESIRALQWLLEHMIPEGMIGAETLITMATFERLIMSLEMPLK